MAAAKLTDFQVIILGQLAYTMGSGVVNCQSMALRLSVPAGTVARSCEALRMKGFVQTRGGDNWYRIMPAGRQALNDYEDTDGGTSEPL